MNTREYRQDDETGRGYCPTCGRELAALDVAGRGVCEQHGRVFADWDQAIRYTQERPYIRPSGWSPSVSDLGVGREDDA